MARRRIPRGMTLIEVLIATALTMLIMLALAQGFKTTSQGISAGRARLSGSDQLRSISNLLRSDLQGLTVSTQVHPQSAKSPTGYFVYYDGPISDSTAMLFNYLPGKTEIEERLSASRWSDIDDVLMFTAKARDGQWFYGRVPLALMKIHSGATSVTFQDWITDVTIASEYAEVVWFMRPLNQIGMLNNPDPQENAGSYSSSPSSTPVVDQIPGVDLNGDNIPDPDGMPDRIALCRRVLLIRPDLDVNLSNLSVPVPADAQLTGSPLPVAQNDADSFRYQMRFAYQRTDLSVRKQWDASKSRFVLKTNSLGDLQRPENRFAHFCLPAGGKSTSLPILALTSENISPWEPPSPTYPHGRNRNGTIPDRSIGRYLSMTNIASPIDGEIPLNYRGFIPAAFCRTNLVEKGNNSYGVQHTLEEIVASNIVGFDVRGWDSSAVELYSQGSDGLWGGLPNIDPTLAQAQAAAGQTGYDDLVVGPSDPGYAAMLKNGPVIPAKSGTFVDLSWGFRVVNQLDNSRMPYGLAHNGFPWFSALSGYDPKNGGVINSMVTSGKFVGRLFHQPTFDTFSDYYESDGNLQLDGISENGMVAYGYSPDISASPDRGIDGIDNNNNDVIDEEAERDTSPPYRYAMPAVQIKLRYQDQTAGTLQELSMVHSLQGN